MGKCQMILNQEVTCSNVSRYLAQMRKDMSLYGRKVVEIDSSMFTEKRLFVKSPDGFPPTCVYDFIHSAKLDILSTHGERREIAES